MFWMVKAKNPDQAFPEFDWCYLFADKKDIQFFDEEEKIIAKGSENSSLWRISPKDFKEITGFNLPLGKIIPFEFKRLKESKKDGLKAWLKRILDNYDDIFVRAKLGGKWESVSLEVLEQLGEKEVIIDSLSNSKKVPLGDD